MFLPLLFCLTLALGLGLIARQVSYTARGNVLRTFSGEGIGNDNTVTVDSMGTNVVLDANSTPAITSDACFDLTLSGGAASLDFTAMVDPNLGSISITGLTPYFFKLINPLTNANPISIAKGASNGYAGFGSTFEITLQPGEEQTILKHVASNVDGTHKILDVTGTGAQVLKVQVAAG
jgi:hypothetical protein